MIFALDNGHNFLLFVCVLFSFTVFCPFFLYERILLKSLIDLMAGKTTNSSIYKVVSFYVLINSVAFC